VYIGTFRTRPNIAVTVRFDLFDTIVIRSLRSSVCTSCTCCVYNIISNVMPWCLNKFTYYTRAAVIDLQPTGKTYTIRALNQLMVYLCIPWYGRWSLQPHFILTTHFRRTKNPHKNRISNYYYSKKQIRFDHSTQRALHNMYIRPLLHAGDGHNNNTNQKKMY